MLNVVAPFKMFCGVTRQPPARRTVEYQLIVEAGNTKGGSITLLLTSCLTGLD